MNKNKLYMNLALILVVLYAVYHFGAPLVNKVITANTTLESKKSEKLSVENQLRIKKAEYFAYKQQQKNLEATLQKNKTELKNIYKPEFYSKDDMTLFSGLLQDITTMAKVAGLKVTSMVFFSNLEYESLLKGRIITTKEMFNATNKLKNSNNNTQKTTETKTNVKGYLVNISFLGSYSSVKKFIEELNNYSYLIKLLKLETFPYANNKNILVSNVSIILFAKM